jgi:hypothetical protein
MDDENVEEETGETGKIVAGRVAHIRVLVMKNKYRF